MERFQVARAEAGFGSISLAPKFHSGTLTNVFNGGRGLEAPPLGCTVQNKELAQPPWGRKAALSAAETHCLIQMQNL